MSLPGTNPIETVFGILWECVDASTTAPFPQLTYYVARDERKKSGIETVCAVVRTKNDERKMSCWNENGGLIMMTSSKIIEHASITIR